jgi:hypothetical protein
MAYVMKHGVLRPHGVGIINDPDRPQETQFDTLQCCHCQETWQVRPGSGRRRGFCARCNQVTCGGPGCEECVPFARKIELYEQGKLASL